MAFGVAALAFALMFVGIPELTGTPAEKIEARNSSGPYSAPGNSKCPRLLDKSCYTLPR